MPVKEELLKKKYLFTDHRHINPNDLKWLAPDGSVLPLYPDGIESDAVASAENVPFGIRLVAQKASKGAPFPKHSSLPGLHYTMIYENGVYRLWHLGTPDNSGNDIICNSEAATGNLEICYLESTDGYDWLEKARSRINAAGYGYDGFTVFIDSSAPSGERYKAVWYANAPREQWDDLWEKYSRLRPEYRTTGIGKRYRTTGAWEEPVLYQFLMGCMYGAVSSDGFTWTLLSDPLFIHKGDSDTAVYYDVRLEKYVMYQRLLRESRRMICRIETEDFRHWSNETIIPVFSAGLEEGLATDVYLSSYTQYPELPDYHLMFPTFYNRYTQESKIKLLSSIEGIHWKEVPGGPVIEPEKDGWDSAWITCSKNLVPMDGSRIGIIYYGTPYPHKYPRWNHVRSELTKAAWAYWEKDRLCAVTADEDGGFCTFSIVPSGRKLYLNARTKKAGFIQVGLRNFSGNLKGRTVQDCDPVTGNNIAKAVSWQGETDIGIKEGMEVELVFRMRAAEIFSFEWV